MSRRGRAGLLLVLVSALGGAACVPFAGTWLVAEDAFDHADAALILSGNPIERALAARDLYREGRVDRIFVIPEPAPPWNAELARLGLLEADRRPWTQRILLASGVPQEKMVFLTEPADGTIVEARQMRRFLKDQFPRQLVIVTSASASRRARYIFRRVLKGKPVVVLSYPSRYGPFRAQRWWSQPRNALSVVMEYQKFLMNVLELTGTTLALTG
ncbi:MAG: YdcF family protein [Candidatus Omnitrophica bacterium]|nr:YdcF family protein [Candidatus Omnitrophota bacterium]